MKKILITRRLIRESEDKASKLFEAKFNSNDELYSQKKVIEMSQGFDGILSSLTEKLDAETINQLPDSVKIISNFAVGFGNIDLEAAKNRDIAVTNTPEVLSDATAEIGILLILGACRRASEGIESAREGGWKWSADYLIGKQLTGTRLGILVPFVICIMQPIFPVEINSGLTLFIFSTFCFNNFFAISDCKIL